MKYGDDESAERYSAVDDYVAVNRAAIREMFRQVGPLRMDDDGIAFRGLCIRHLVLPEGRACTGKILDFLKSTFDPQDLYISLMAQYRPLFRAAECPEINRLLDFDEYEPLRQNVSSKAGSTGFIRRSGAWTSRSSSISRSGKRSGCGAISSARQKVRRDPLCSNVAYRRARGLKPAFHSVSRRSSRFSCRAACLSTILMKKPGESIDDAQVRPGSPAPPSTTPAAFSFRT